MDSRLTLIGAGLAMSAACFMLWGLRPPYDYVVPFRATKLAGLVVVGAATGMATILFQTITGSRLLAPGIVGFDALFVFLQTFLVLTLGAAGYVSLPPMLRFAAETGCLTAAGLALFGWMLRRGAEDMLRLVLTGVILGTFLRGLSGFAQRILDPSEFAVVQQAGIASFNAIPRDQLGLAAIALALAFAAGLRLAPSLDIASLGRTKAMSLGLDHDGLVRRALALVAVTVAVSTALVGPVTFLGLLAAALAQALVPGAAHRRLIPAAAMIGAIVLVAGQFVFERLLGLQSALAIVVEFAGGLLFLALVLRRRPE